MLIKIIGNKNYMLDTESKKVMPLYNGAEPLKQDEARVFIKLYDEEPKWVRKDWLMLVYKYNLELPYGYEHAIQYFRFRKHNPSYKTVDSEIVIFDKPVKHKTLSGYRMIARYPNYFINANGKIYSEKHKKHLNVKINPSRYPRVTLRDQSGLTSAASPTIHRLVGLTWVENDNFIEKPIIDHIDGDKNNCSKDNLRWVSYKSNVNAAFKNDLMCTNIPIKIRNLKTDEETTCPSINSAMKFIGNGTTNVGLKSFIPGRIWKGKNGVFEMVPLAPENSWKVKKLSGNPLEDYTTTTQTSIIEITHDNKTETYNNWREVKVKVLEVKPETSYTIPTIIQMVKRKYPGVIIKYSELKGVVGRNGDEVIYAKSVRDMVGKVGINFNNILICCKTGVDFGGWTFERNIVKKYE